MLEYLGHPNAAEAIVIETVLVAGPPTREINGNASTAEVRQAIAI